MNKKTPIISLISPLYNEQEVIDDFLKSISKVLKETELSYELLLVDDGSEDSTLEILLQFKEKYQELRIIRLSRNFGKEAALTAGLDHALGDVVIPIDCDLQDPPELIHEMIKKWREGYDVVLAKRADRSNDQVVKRVTAELFYKVHNKIAATEVPENVGDYRLMTRKVVDALKQLPENQRFMKGLFAWAGFKTATIEYTREKRVAGRSSFNSWKLWNLALEGITSFSTVPLRIWMYLGLFFSIFSFIYGSFIIFRTLILGVDVPGYASLLTSVLFIGGIQLLGIGVIGEYLGRMYQEVKKRPIYLVDKEY